MIAELLERIDGSDRCTIATRSQLGHTPWRITTSSQPGRWFELVQGVAGQYSGACGSRMAVPASGRLTLRIDSSIKWMVSHVKRNLPGGLSVHSGRRKKGPLIKEPYMLKFIGGTIGAIFLIGLIVVVLFLKLIF
jgi:hypothetical protein